MTKGAAQRRNWTFYEAITRKDQQYTKERLWMFRSDFWHTRAPRLLAGAVGIVFLAAAVLKSTDMELFIREIQDYGIISHPLAIMLSAWGLITWIFFTHIALTRTPRCRKP